MTLSKAFLYCDMSGFWTYFVSSKTNYKSLYFAKQTHSFSCYIRTYLCFYINPYRAVQCGEISRAWQLLSCLDNYCSKRGYSQSAIARLRYLKIGLYNTSIFIYLVIFILIVLHLKLLGLDTNESTWKPFDSLLFSFITLEQNCSKNKLLKKTDVGVREPVYCYCVYSFPLTTTGSIIV